jgi:hypothetical protein
MHSQGRRALLAAATATATTAAMLFAAVGTASAAPDPALDTGVLRSVTLGASLGFPSGQQVGTPHGIQSPELPPKEQEETDRSLSREMFTSTAVSPTGVPIVDSTAVTGPAGLIRSFQGLNGFDQRFANNGNQFSVEPPDQALCVGNGYVLEAVNTVLRVYRTGGSAVTAVTDLNTFYGYEDQINRTTGEVGPFLTDPVCLFDEGTQRFFLTVLTLEVDAVGNFTGRNHLDTAVSKTADPTAGFRIYRLPVQDDGSQGTPAHKDCPCIGDYPHIAADKYGYYITTNEYPFSDDPGVFGNNFNGAQIYAFDKLALVNGNSRGNVVQFSRTALRLAFRPVPGFTLAPAQVPGTAYATVDNGTQYFLSSIAGAEAQPRGFTGQAQHIGVYALTNTRSLRDATPAVSLAGSLRASERYVLPPLTNQRPGPTPLANYCTAQDCFGFGPSPEVEGPLDSGDTRMLQVFYAHGRLYGALDTAVQVSGQMKAGIAWFLVNPGSAPSRSSVANQGYIGVAGQNVIYPAIAARSDGMGAVAYTLAGSAYYPSAAYSLVGPTGVTGPVHMAAAGAGPQDGFTEYVPQGDAGSAARPRWGDYGAAVISGSTVWLASEYIGQSCSFRTYQIDMTCGGTRAPLINWATRISAVTP